MNRAVGCLQILALAAAAAGVVSFLLLYRPLGFGDLVGIVVFFLPRALAHPLVPILALAAIVATVAARLIERRSRHGRPSPKAHVLDAEPPPSPFAGDGNDDSTARPEVASARGRDVITLVDDVLRQAIARGASDVHVQPREGDSLVSLRVDGALSAFAEIAPEDHLRLVRRLKVMADLVVYRTDRPQDGRFTLRTPHGPVDVRISVLPTQHGEKVVLRLARAAAGLRPFDALGMPDAMRRRFADLLERPEGLIVLTGPTGSGKTTTIYASLAHLHAARGDTVNIATIEDPVEVDMPFLSQTQVQPARGLGFAEGLRAVLRQDPNVMMVGEIRDPETASIAIQAGLTGHLILTTVHADAAAGVFNRLIDAGVEPFRVASAVLACVAQRLVKRLCPVCRQPTALSAEAANHLGRRGIAIDGRTFYRAVGCDHCGNSGVHGRLALFELLEVTPALRDTIVTKVPTQAIEAAAVEDGMTPLAAAAVDAAAEGEIALDDALRVVA